MVVEKTFYYYDNDIDIKTTYVKYSNTGSARLIATSAITMSCSADILLFPFDSQECEVQYMTSFADSMVATIVMKTMKVNTIVKANDGRSPDKA
jgi:hypothetical protein